MSYSEYSKFLIILIFQGIDRDYGWSNKRRGGGGYEDRIPGRDSGNHVHGEPREPSPLLFVP